MSIDKNTQIMYDICMSTINISLPKNMYEDAKKILVAKRYASISELIRDALRRVLYENITENGFTNQFEDEILHAASESTDKELLLKTDKDIEKYFNNPTTSKKS